MAKRLAGARDKRHFRRDSMKGFKNPITTIKRRGGYYR